MVHPVHAPQRIKFMLHPVAPVQAKVSEQRLAGGVYVMCVSHVYLA